MSMGSSALYRHKNGASLSASIGPLLVALGVVGRGRQQIELIERHLGEVWCRRLRARLVVRFLARLLTRLLAVLRRQHFDGPGRACVVERDRALVGTRLGRQPAHYRRVVAL